MYGSHGALESSRKPSCNNTYVWCDPGTSLEQKKYQDNSATNPPRVTQEDDIQVDEIILVSIYLSLAEEVPGDAEVVGELDAVVDGDRARARLDVDAAAPGLLRRPHGGPLLCECRFSGELRGGGGGGGGESGGRGGGWG
jgi:uncharacterized membrane protein YgcG